MCEEWRPGQDQEIIEWQIHPHLLFKWQKFRWRSEKKEEINGDNYARKR